MAPTLLGRRYIVVGNDDISPAVRRRAISTARAITIVGCRKSGRITSAATEGVVAAEDFSCCCERCGQNDPAMCCLVRKGIAQAPAELSRKRSDPDEISPRDTALKVVFIRLLTTLDFGSFALFRVHPAENYGEKLVPIAIGRKAPCERSAASARDGMFDQGDAMIFIHEFEQNTRGIFEVPNLLSEEITRAVPTKCVAGPGEGIVGYISAISGPTGAGVPHGCIAFDRALLRRVGRT